jgi:hypothetical protein
VPPDPRSRPLRPRAAHRARPRRRASGERAATVERPDPPRPLTRRFPIRTTLALGAVLGSALLALGLAQSDGGRALLDDAGLAPPEEPYTALAFARPAELPQAPRAGAEIAIDFHIDNHEGARRTYSWWVVERSGEGSAVRSGGRAAVEDGARATVRTRAFLACPGRRARIAVVLEEPSREIGFWAACPGSEAAS